MEEQLFTYTDEEVNEVVVKIYPRVVAYIRGFFGASRFASQAEDIFHDVLCAFLDRRAVISRSRVQAYLFRSVRNRCLNIATRNRIERSSVSLDSVSEAWDALSVLDCAAHEPDYDFDSDEGIDLADVMAYSATLPERTRDIFYMSRIEGLTHREIAERCGISVRAVEKHLQNSTLEYRRHFGFGKDNPSKPS